MSNSVQGSNTTHAGEVHSQEASHSIPYLQNRVENYSLQQGDRSSSINLRAVDIAEWCHRCNSAIHQQSVDHDPTLACDEQKRSNTCNKYSAARAVFPNVVKPYHPACNMMTCVTQQHFHCRVQCSLLYCNQYLLERTISQ